MAKGFQPLREIARQNEERRKAAEDGKAERYSGPPRVWFRLPNSGDFGVVRFIDEAPQWCWMHSIDVPNRQFGQDVPCIDQDEKGERIGAQCVACDFEVGRRVKGFINVIWFDGPVFDKNSEGRTDYSTVVGREDVVAIWSTGITVLQDLDDLDTTYKGLHSRPFKVTRRGQKLLTTYSIAPADPDGGPKELSEAEKALVKNRHDLTEFVTIPTPDEMSRIMRLNDQEETPSVNERQGDDDNLFVKMQQRRAQKT